MDTKVAIIGAGQMGAAIGGLLQSNGVEVVIDLDGRSSASIQSAENHQLRSGHLEEIVSAGIVLSIVPPGEADKVADRVIGMLRRVDARPLFVDCNALSPLTKRNMNDRICSAGAQFQDAVIIGLPPGRGDSSGPVLFTSGKHNTTIQKLRTFGLVVKSLDGKVGSASALKMSFGGINKGLTALVAAMVSQARRTDSETRICEELCELMPILSSRFAKSVPQMYPKAHRWVAEMNEIASYLGDDPESAAVFEALGNFFAKRAKEVHLE